MDCDNIRTAPDPVTVAPPVDTIVATSLATATEFLYTGSDPIQTGVNPGYHRSKTRSRAARACVDT